jgi:hypothetical protein
MEICGGVLGVLRWEGVNFPYLGFLSPPNPLIPRYKINTTCSTWSFTFTVSFDKKPSACHFWWNALGKYGKCIKNLQ